MSERAIPDVWEVFEKQGIRRNNSWKRMMTEEEKTVTELFSDLHLHARSYDLPGDHLPVLWAGEQAFTILHADYTRGKIHKRGGRIRLRVP